MRSIHEGEREVFLMQPELSFSPVAEMIARGAFDKEIADRFGISLNAVWQFRKDNRIQSGRSQTFSELREKALLLLASGKPGYVVAAELQIAPCTVSRWRRGFVERKRPEKGKKRKARRVDA